jgi:hypothetical protein
VPHSYDRSASFIRGRYGTEYLSVLRLIDGAAFPASSPTMTTMPRPKLAAAAFSITSDETDHPLLSCHERPGLIAEGGNGHYCHGFSFRKMAVKVNPPRRTRVGQ